MWFFALIVVVLIGAVAVVASGRWGAMSTAYDDRPDMSVPARQALTSDDIETARFGVGLRGYRMDEVDTLLERVAREVAERDRRIADLERAVTPIMHGPEGAGFTSRHTYDADDFDDTGYQLPILVGGDFPPETTTTTPPPNQAATPVAQDAESELPPPAQPQAAQATSPDVPPTPAQPVAAVEPQQTSEPQAPRVAESEVPPTAVQPATAVEPQQTSEPQVPRVAEPEIPPTAAQPVAAVEPRQTFEPEAANATEPEAPEARGPEGGEPEAPKAERSLAEPEAAPEFPVSQTAHPEAPPAVEQTAPKASEQAAPQAAEHASHLIQPDVPQVDRASVLEAPLPPVPPEPVLQQHESAQQPESALQQPDEVQEQATWWPAAESTGARPAAKAQEAPQSGQLWADPGAAAVANGQQEAQASSGEQQAHENGQAGPGQLGGENGQAGPGQLGGENGQAGPGQLGGENGQAGPG
ncbi:DivIVA domain-containing protein, partial [Kribbella voronezhensis]|uniref:DivIVA domain-containing protein n=1 Tax=Kribbella voronezhensis TaxID=2512212 RepID=UPI001EDFBA7E